MAIPKELDELIQEYLTDGIITPKERQVLLNKAQKLGLDVDEIDLYIDAQEQKFNRQVDAAVRMQKGQSCPFCGASVPQLADKCPQCGQHITAEASDELKEIIENLEDTLVEFKSGNDFARNKANVEKYMRKAQLYYSSNPKIKTLVEQVKEESEIAEKKAKSDAKKKTLVKILTYNKWITLIVILILIGGICYGISAMKGPDPADDPKACIEAIDDALQDGNINKAEALWAAYSKKHLTWDIDPGTCAIIDYCLENGDLTKANGYIEELKFDSRSAYKEKLVDALLKSGKYYEAADKLIGSSISVREVPYLTKILIYMKNNGVSSDEIRALAEAYIAKASPEGSYHSDKEAEAYEEARAQVRKAVNASIQF